MKYLKEQCGWSVDEQFFFKYFLNIAFVREILSKLSGSSGCYRQTLENNFGIKYELIKYLKEHCGSSVFELFIKHFLNIAFVK